MSNKDYVQIVYNEKDRPLTAYPYQLTQYLTQRYNLKKGQRILDVGCGRGEFLDGFRRQQLKTFGIDQSLAANKYFPDLAITQVNLDDAVFPFDDNSFDIIFSKSVLEHFYFPEKLYQEIFRVLKPGGLVIMMTPDWAAVYKSFYEDFTHRTPFTLQSLKDIGMINGFEEVQVERFLQLPFVWRMKYLKPFCRLLGILSPRFLHKRNKLLRFSHEVMLLSSARKPISN